MPAHNDQLARLFQQMADGLELLGANRFKVISFQRAARVLGEMPEDVASFTEQELTEIEGIGKGTAQRIAEFLKTGSIDEHQKIVADVPPGLFRVLGIPGLGPKTVKQLWDEAQVTDLQTLTAALGSGQLEKLKGFGKKKIENIQKNLAFMQTAVQRTRLGSALPLAEAVVAFLRQIEQVQRCDFAGSLRRGKETIGDIDILCAADSEHASKIMDHFTGMDIVADVIVKGQTKASVRADSERGGIQIDLRVVAPESYGPALMYFTGSKEHNVRLRERAQTLGYTLNEYALSVVEGADKNPPQPPTPKPRDRHPAVPPKNAAAPSNTTAPDADAYEAPIYQALGLAWVPPELREDRGELALAEAGELPQLITADDIRAELHAHTTASDGVWSEVELVEAAIERGFHTVAITDHSRSQFQANGLDADRLREHIELIRMVADRYKDRIRVLAGSEVDILSDGSLDYPDKLLAKLDIVVASPHAALSQDPDKATARLLRAIDNPYVTILGHPTGRLVGKREGLSPDMPRLYAAAAKRGIAMEVNANHYRLDLRDTHARAALAAGVKLAINTDAHGPADLDQLRYGLFTARRAGATRNDVVNCLGPDQLATWIKSTRP